MFKDVLITDITHVIRGDSSVDGIYTSTDNLLIYKSSGDANYFFNEKTAAGEDEEPDFCLTEGEVLYIPPLIKYRVRRINPGKYITLTFSASGNPPLSPLIFSPGDQVVLQDIFDRLVYLHLFPNEANMLQCKALLYELFSIFVRSKSESDYIKKDRKRLENAIKYLRAHIFDPELNVTKLCDIAEMSGTYFRKLFKEIYKRSPHDFITSHRIGYAKSLIETGQSESVSEIAASVGYEDPLYFSKVFKKITGLPPKDYLKVKSVNSQKY